MGNKIRATRIKKTLEDITIIPDDAPVKLPSFRLHVTNNKYFYLIEDADTPIVKKNQGGDDNLDKTFAYRMAGRIIGHRGEGLVVWKDSFYTRFPELKAYNTYREQVTTGTMSTGIEYQLVFKPKVSNIEQNSMQEEQAYQAGGTWFLDHILENTAFLGAINRTFKTGEKNIRLISLAYYIVLQETTDFSYYNNFVAQTRLPFSAPQQESVVESFLASISEEERFSFMHNLQSIHNTKSKNVALNAIDVELPCFIAEKINLYGYCLSLNNHELENTISRDLSKLNLNNRQALQKYRAHARKFDDRILILANECTGEIHSFFTYNSFDISFSDIIEFIKERNSFLQEEKERDLEQIRKERLLNLSLNKNSDEDDSYNHLFTSNKESAFSNTISIFANNATNYKNSFIKNSSYQSKKKSILTPQNLMRLTPNNLPSWLIDSNIGAMDERSYKSMIANVRAINIPKLNRDEILQMYPSLQKSPEKLSDNYFHTLQSREAANNSGKEKGDHELNKARKTKSSDESINKDRTLPTLNVKTAKTFDKKEGEPSFKKSKTNKQTENVEHSVKLTPTESDEKPLDSSIISQENHEVSSNFDDSNNIDFDDALNVNDSILDASSTLNVDYSTGISGFLDGGIDSPFLDLSNSNSDSDFWGNEEQSLKEAANPSSFTQNNLADNSQLIGSHNSSDDIHDYNEITVDNETSSNNSMLETSRLSTSGSSTGSGSLLDADSLPVDGYLSIKDSLSGDSLSADGLFSDILPVEGYLTIDDAPNKLHSAASTQQDNATNDSLINVEEVDKNARQLFAEDPTHYLNSINISKTRDITPNSDVSASAQKYESTYEKELDISKEFNDIEHYSPIEHNHQFGTSTLIGGGFKQGRARKQSQNTISSTDGKSADLLEMSEQERFDKMTELKYKELWPLIYGKTMMNNANHGKYLAYGSPLESIDDNNGTHGKQGINYVSIDRYCNENDFNRLLKLLQNKIDFCVELDTNSILKKSIVRRFSSLLVNFENYDVINKCFKLNLNQKVRIIDPDLDIARASETKNSKRVLKDLYITIEVDLDVIKTIVKRHTPPTASYDVSRLSGPYGSNINLNATQGGSIYEAYSSVIEGRDQVDDNKPYSMSDGDFEDDFYFENESELLNKDDFFDEYDEELYEDMDDEPDDSIEENLNEELDRNEQNYESLSKDLSSRTKHEVPTIYVAALDFTVEDNESLAQLLTKEEMHVLKTANNHKLSSDELSKLIAIKQKIIISKQRIARGKTGMRGFWRSTHAKREQLREPLRISKKLYRKCTLLLKTINKSYRAYRDDLAELQEEFEQQCSTNPVLKDKLTQGYTLNKFCRVGAPALKLANFENYLKRSEYQELNQSFYDIIREADYTNTPIIRVTLSNSQFHDSYSHNSIAYGLMTKQMFEQISLSRLKSEMKVTSSIAQKLSSTLYHDRNALKNKEFLLSLALGVRFMAYAKFKHRSKELNSNHLNSELHIKNFAQYMGLLQGITAYRRSDGIYYNKLTFLDKALLDYIGIPLPSLEPFSDTTSETKVRLRRDL